MPALYLVHILAGALGLLSGYLALSASKGGSLHRRAGMLFVCTMLTMSAGGFLIAMVRDVAPAVNLPAAVLTGYLVLTSLTTLRPRLAGSRLITVAGLLVALGVTVVSLRFAFEAVTNGGVRNGMPAFPFFLFGVTGLLAALGDLRVSRFGPLQGHARLGRHLWRMCFALFIAALSFFIGQAKVIPEPIRIPGLLALPVLVPLLALFYWLWRVRIRRSVRGIVGAGAPGVV